MISVCSKSIFTVIGLVYLLYPSTHLRFVNLVWRSGCKAACIHMVAVLHQAAEHCWGNRKSCLATTGAAELGDLPHVWYIKHQEWWIASPGSSSRCWWCLMPESEDWLMFSLIRSGRVPLHCCRSQICASDTTVLYFTLLRSTESWIGSIYSDWIWLVFLLIKSHLYSSRSGRFSTSLFESENL